MKKRRAFLKKLFSADEPEYFRIKEQLTEKDYEILEQLIIDEPALAPVVINCLGLMNSTKSLKGIEMGSKSDDPELREAAAFALRHCSRLPGVVKLLNGLLDDKDLGVRKAALKTLVISPIVELRNKVEEQIGKEQNERIKELAQIVLIRLDKPFI
jgi:HEAT repeat protein